MILAENPLATQSARPVTPPYHATEGHANPSGATTTYTYDISGAGVPREAQRITAVTCDYGVDNILQSGTDTNIGKHWIDTARKEYVRAIRRLRRVHFLLGPAYMAGLDSFAFAATGYTLTYGANDGRNLLGGAITPGLDLACCDLGGYTDLAVVTGVTLGDTTATITTSTPLDPSAWSDTITIFRPSEGSFPLVREDRSHYVERKETAWLAVATFASAYAFATRPIAYPLKYQVYAVGGGRLFDGTFKVTGAEDAAGTNPQDLTELILGATPASGYDYPLFPSPTGALKFTNTPGATLDFSGIAIPGGVTHAKIFYCEQIADEAVPDSDSIAPTQTTCKYCIKAPANSAIAGYSGAGDILDLYANGYFCSKYASLTAPEVAAYAGPCNNSACAQYATYETGFVPNVAHINAYWLDRGEYYLQDTVGLPGVTFGRDNFDGLLCMMGGPRDNKTGLYLPKKSWSGWGRFLHDTEEIDATTGYRIFRDWEESVAQAIADTGSADDTDTGLFATLAPYASKKDPAGGTWP